MKSIYRLFSSPTAINTIYVLTGNTLSILFAFFFTVSLARLLSIDDFGIFSALLSFLILFSEVADAGIGNSLSRFLPKFKKEVTKRLEFQKSSLILQSVIILLLILVLTIFSSVIINSLFHNQKFIELVLIVTVFGVSFQTLTNFFQYTLAAQEKFIQVAAISSFSSLLRLLFLIPLVMFSKVALYVVVIIQIASLVISCLFAFLLVKPNFLRARYLSSNLKKLLFFTSYLGVARTLSAISARLDLVMLIALSSAFETGIYAMAVKVIAVYPIFIGSFLTVIGPKIALIKDKVYLKQFLYKVILVTAGFIVSILIFQVISYPFMTFIFGIKAAPAVPIIRLLLLSMIFLVASIPPVALAVYYLKKPYILTINSVLQIAIVVIGNILLIPKWGGLGAAFSLLSAYGLSFFLTSYMAFVYFKRGKLR